MPLGEQGHGEWEVDCIECDDGTTEVFLSLTVMADSGVENFETNLPPDNAIALGGQALIDVAREVQV